MSKPRHPDGATIARHAFAEGLRRPEPETVPEETLTATAQQLFDDLVALGELGFTGHDVMTVMAAALVELTALAGGTEDRLELWRDFSDAVANAIRRDANLLN